MPIPQPASEGAALIALIERAARDPSVDIDKMQRLLDMRHAMAQREAEQAFWTAMSAAQQEMRQVSADASNPSTRSRYASYAALDRALRPIYTRHGFALSFDTEDSPKPDHVRVVCDVACAGYVRRYHRDIPADGAGAKGGAVMTRTHAAGSADTYGRRYILLGIFNIAVSQRDDDDGNAAGGQPGNGGHLSEQQIDTIRSLIVDTASDIGRFCRFMGVERIEDISVNKFATAVAALEAKRARK
jgi:hypothetical protein